MKTFFKLFMAALLIGIISLGFVGYKSYRLPTTVEMEEFFAAHRSGFEHKNTSILYSLQNKVAVDSGLDTTVGYQWLEMEPKADLYEDGGPVIIRYYTHLRGIGVGAFGVGIAYIDPSDQEKNYTNLEAMTDDARKIEGFIGYSHISGNWHTFLWEAD